MTAAEMLDALTREQVAIVGHYAAALVSERTRPGALAYFGDLVGERSFEGIGARPQGRSRQGQALHHHQRHIDVGLCPAQHREDRKSVV